MEPKPVILASAIVIFAGVPLLKAGEAPVPAVSTAAAATAVSTAATAAIGSPVTPARAGVIDAAMKHLAALRERGGGLSSEAELDSVVAETAALDSRIKKYLGPALLDELEKAEKVRRAIHDLQYLRSLLIAYYADHAGSYPASLQDLVPLYLAAIPELELPDHPRSAEVEKGAGAAVAKAVTDAGGWLYFGEPGSVNRGMLVMNCSHKDRNGHEFYKY